MKRRALVYGGSGAVGREVVRALDARGVPTTFTYHRGEDVAEELVDACDDASAVHLDLGHRDSFQAFLDELGAGEPFFDVFIHCAAVAHAAELEEMTDEDLLAVHRVNAFAPVATVRALAPAMENAGGGDVVFVGALEPTQTLPLPVAFAMSQGSLNAATSTLGKELGGRGIRVNMVALGVLEEGLSRQLSASLFEDYEHFSALRRLGSPAEAARAIVWFALNNSYMNGEVVPVNGGI